MSPATNLAFTSAGCVYGQPTDALRYAYIANLSTDNAYPYTGSTPVNLTAATCNSKRVSKATAAGNVVQLNTAPGYARVYPTVEGLVLDVSAGGGHMRACD